MPIRISCFFLRQRLCLLQLPQFAAANCPICSLSEEILTYEGQLYADTYDVLYFIDPMLDKMIKGLSVGHIVDEKDSVGTCIKLAVLL